MPASANGANRVFKTAWFARAARKAGIDDRRLCEAIKQVILGQADDLGGGVFKKRLNNNLYRSIILAKGGRHWVYAYVFAKKDRSNIDDTELKAFRELAKGYERLTDPQLTQLFKDKDLTEICHGNQT